MRTVELLRQTLVDQSAAAPDGIGFVETAHARVARIRTRRRVIAAVAVVALAAGAAVVPNAVSRLVLTEPSLAPLPARPRGPFQTTVDVAPKSGYQKVGYGVIGPRQHMQLMMSAGDRNVWRDEVVVHDPGTFDAAPFQSGEKVTVRGHPAFYVTDLLIGVVIGTVLPPIDPTRREEIRVPAIGWSEPSGAWVIVYRNPPTREVDTDTKAQLLRVAEAVRIGAPRDMRASFELGYIPSGLAGQWVRVATGDRPGPSSVGLGPQPLAVDMFTWSQGHVDTPLTIRMLPFRDMWDGLLESLGPPEVTVAGFDAWYNTEGTPGWQVAPNTGHLMVHAGECWLEVSSANLTQVPYEELLRVAEGARLADCMQPGTWRPPLR
jgi:hypothetical protein